jgi:hypothetical protein
MNANVIVIDGKTYNSVNEMPPDIRQKYEQAMRALGDANGNQIPDAFERFNIFADKDKNDIPDVVEHLTAGQAAVNSMKIIVDGQEFNGLENLPPEARARYNEAMGKLDANQNGIPDFAEGMMNTASMNPVSSSGFAPEAPRHSAPLSSNSAITPDTSNGWMLVLAGLFLFLFCVAGAGAVWYFFLR